MIAPWASAAVAQRAMASRSLAAYFAPSCRSTIWRIGGGATKGAGPGCAAGVGADMPHSAVAPAIRKGVFIVGSPWGVGLSRKSATKVDCQAVAVGNLNA